MHILYMSVLATFVLIEVLSLDSGNIGIGTLTRYDAKQLGGCASITNCVRHHDLNKMGNRSVYSL